MHVLALCQRLTANPQGGSKVKVDRRFERATITGFFFFDFYVSGIIGLMPLSETRGQVCQLQIQTNSPGNALCEEAVHFGLNKLCNKPKR